jgi:hypothetical protein
MLNLFALLDTEIAPKMQAATVWHKLVLYWVTRLGEFSPIWRLFSLVFYRSVLYKFWQKCLGLHFGHFFLQLIRSPWTSLRIPRANPTIVSYNASVVNFYNATGSLARLEKQKKIFNLLLKTL